MALDDIKIRKVEITDIGILDHLAKDVFDEEVNRARLVAFLAERTHWLLVAIKDNVVVGKVIAMVHLRPDKIDELYIDEIDVTPSLRRQGIGKLLLERTLELADDWGCEECWLGTEKDNMPARKLYESNGAEAEEVILYYLEF